MATNKILPWAQTGTANVLSDDAYAADVATRGLYGDGVKTGQASSQQANKTWRQATAPGSGLGQFLVDNLSVDVTDADTPSTFSSRIANAILKLAQISPFNQSWAAATGGYRKYAIVSDSSGNYWVSTADQNMTVPGASGANWQSLFNGYATEAWVNGQFLQLADTETQTVTGPVEFRSDIHLKTSGGEATPQIYYDRNGIPAFSMGVDSSGNLFISRYASTSAGAWLGEPVSVNGETGEVTINSSIIVPTPTDYSQKQAIGASDADARYVKKTGDIMTGALFAENDPNLQPDGYNYSPVLKVFTTGRAGFRMFSLDKAGSSVAGGALVYDWNGTDAQHWWFGQDGAISNSSKGNVAWQSDLPKSGTITGGTYTKTPMNDGTGRSVLVQNIYLGLLKSDPYVAFPIAVNDPKVSFGCTTENGSKLSEFVNVQLDSNNNPMISNNGATLHMSAGAEDVIPSGLGAYVWMTVTGVV